jgi:hypothetical protein
MKVREIHVSDSDKRSAEIFFEALLKFWDLRTGHALDAFARNGQLTLACYHNKIGRVTAWELGEEHRAALERFQLYDLQIGDSYARANPDNPSRSDKYDLIVIDTPQGAHKDGVGRTHYEHFDFMRMALRNLAQRKCILVVYVNKSPYDKNEVGSHGYDEYEEYDYPQWLRERSDFYLLNCGTELTEDQAIAAYRRLCHGEGYKVKSVLTVPCFSDVSGKEPYSFRLALEVERED